MIHVATQYSAESRFPSAAETRRDRPFAGVIDNTVYVFPGYTPRCVARKVKGGRCRNRLYDIWDGHVGWGGRLVVVKGGRRYDVRADMLADHHAHQAEAFLRQRCHVHDGTDAPDWCAPEWYEFDPERDSGFLLPSVSGSVGRDVAAVDAAVAAAAAAFDECVEQGVRDAGAVAERVGGALVAVLGSKLAGPGVGA